MARKTEELIVADFDVELTSAQLMAINVPVNYYAEKGAEAITYHVDISFADFKDIKRRAIEKVKHTVGHAIRENKISADFDADGKPLPRTVVDSTGYPPKSDIETLEKFAAAAKAGNKSDAEKKRLKAMLLELAKSL